MMRLSAVVGALFVFVACRGTDRPPAADSPATSAGVVANAVLDSSVRAGPKDDHAVYSAVLREHFMRSERGEHGLHCQPDEGPGDLTIVGTTQTVPKGTPARDSAWAAELPASARPLMFSLRAMDAEAGRVLHRDSITVGVPVTVVSDSAAARMFRPATASAGGTTVKATPLFWLSRVAYTDDGTWALVYGVEVCAGVTESQAADAENGAYERVLLAPVEWRNGAWTTHPPVYLDIGLPRLVPR